MTNNLLWTSFLESHWDLNLISNEINNVFACSYSRGTTVYPELCKYIKTCSEASLIEFSRGCCGHQNKDQIYSSTFSGLLISMQLRFSVTCSTTIHFHWGLMLNYANHVPWVERAISMAHKRSSVICWLSILPQFDTGLDWLLLWFSITKQALLSPGDTLGMQLAIIKSHNSLVYVLSPIINKMISDFGYMYFPDYAQ